MKLQALHVFLLHEDINVNLHNIISVQAMLITEHGYTYDRPPAQTGQLANCGPGQPSTCSGQEVEKAMMLYFACNLCSTWSGEASRR